MPDSHPDLRYRFPFAVRLRILAALLLVPTYYVLMFVLVLFIVALGIGPLVGSAYVILYRPLLFRLALPIGFCGLFMVLGALSMIRAVIVSFRTPPAFEPAIWINQNREPTLARVVQEMCAMMGARAPDAIILHVGTQCFAAQRELTVLNANPRGRILCLGLGLLSCINVNELRAIIAHEFAHFIGGDLLYTSIVLRGFIGTEAAWRSLDEVYSRSGGLSRAVGFLPFWLCSIAMHVYLFVLARIDSSVSRAREFRADALAARTCGTLICADVLKKSHAYGDLFESSILEIAGEIQRSRHPDESCLRVWRKNLRNLDSVAQKTLWQSLSQQTNHFDSHPSLRERIENLPPIPNRFEDTRPALSLLKELPKHEKMAGEYLANEFRIAQRFGNS